MVVARHRSPLLTSCLHCVGCRVSISLQGLSIMARQQQPGYILPFLYVLQSVAAGADQEAGASRAVFRAQLQAAVAEAAAAGLVSADGVVVVSEGGSEGDSEREDESEGDSTGRREGREGQQQAARYFKQRLRKQEQQDPAASKHSVDPSKPPPQQPPGNAANSSQPAAATTAAAAVGTGCRGSSTDGPSGMLDDVPVLPTAKKLRVSPAQLEELELSWRRAHSAGSLAAAAVDAAMPLLLQRNLRCAVLSVQVLTAALQGLAAATEAVDVEEQLFDRLLDRGPDAALKPNRPTPAKLLPAVHGVWPLLLAALQDTGSVALLEQQLSLLAVLVQLAGGKFMAKRFQRDAWPLLQRLLKAGPQAGAAALAASTAASTVGGGAAAAAALLGVGAGPGSDTRDLLALTGQPSGRLEPGAGDNTTTSSSSSVFGSALSSMRATASSSSSLNAAVGAVVSSETGVDEGGPLAPATLQRVQLAVLGCLSALAGSASAAAALQGPLMWDMCVLAAPFLSDNQALALREAAARLLVAAADVDADAVWLLLLDLGTCFEDICQLLPAAAAVPEEQGLPRLARLLVSPPTSSTKQGGWRQLLSSSAAASCGRRAAALLPRVEAAPVAWHAKAEQQLRVLAA